MGSASPDVTSVFLLSVTLPIWKWPAKSLPARRHLQGKSNPYMAPGFAQLSSFSEQQLFPSLFIIPRWTYLNTSPTEEDIPQYLMAKPWSRKERLEKPQFMWTCHGSLLCRGIWTTERCQRERATKSKADEMVWKNKAPVYLRLGAQTVLRFTQLYLQTITIWFLYLFNSDSRYRRGQHTSHFSWLPQISVEILYREKLHIEAGEIYYVFG